MQIKNISQLREHYGKPGIRAQKKQLSALDEHCKMFIQNSPFLTLATVGTAGKLDCSPRGGKPGFVKVMDPNVIIIADARGNNRLDSLENIVETGQVGTLFMVPGIDETLRLNGSAVISTEPEYLKLFDDERHPPVTCIVIHVEEVYLHCAKAFMRSKLWGSDSQVDRSKFPTMGQILNDQVQGNERIESQEEMVERYKKDL